MTASSADTLYVRNNATVLGSITAQTLVVQTVTSSVLFTTGSNKIGSSLSNVQELTGSVGITGSLAVNGAATVSTTLSISDDFTLASTNPQIKWNAGNLRFTSLTAGNVMVTVNETGSVGIGTTAPQATLDVRGKYYAIASIADNIVEVINSDTTNGYGLYVRAGGTATNRYVARFKNGADTDVMWLDKGGNVGIGTTTPSYSLQVEAPSNSIAAYFKAGGTAGYASIAFSGGTGTKIGAIATTTTGIFLGRANGTIGNQFGCEADIFISGSNGNVGMGTTSPNHLLTLSATASNKTEIGLYNTFNDASNRNWVIATNQTAFADFHLIQSNAQNGNPTSSGTTRLMINASGNVGIGTTSPTERLTVNAGAASSSTNYAKKNIVVNGGFTSGYSGTAIQSLLAGYDGTYYGTDIGYGYDGTGYPLMFSTNDDLSGNPIERMRINSTGVVLIGSTSTIDYLTRLRLNYASDSCYLDVSSGAGDASLRLTGNYGQIRNTTGSLYISCEGATGDMILRTGNTTERMRITNTGRVGIGINSPETTLDVSGTTRITGGGRFYMNNSIMMGYVLQHGDLANGDGSNTTVTDAKATNGTAKKRASGASSNTFFYGPYHTLPAGNYVAGFRMKVANNSSSSRIVSIDVSNVVAVSGASALAPNNFASSDTYQYFKIYFTVADPTAQIEFRGLSFVTGITDIFLDHILVMPNLMV